MNNPPGSVLSYVEDKLGEEVTVKSYDVAYGMANYCLLTGTSGRKFAAMFCEEPGQIFIEEKDGNVYAKARFLIEAENIRALSKNGIAVPAILHAGNNFIIWPYLGENLSLDDSVVSESSWLDEAVLRIIDHLAAINCLPVNTIPHRVRCSRDNLEFPKNYSFLRIIGSSDNALARNMRNARNYGRLCELMDYLSGISVEDGIIKGETYNPETIFLDGNKIHFTDYKFTGTGNPFLDIVCPVSWGLPCDADKAVSKKQERVRRYLIAIKIDDEQNAFFKFDYFTVLESLNMMDVLSGINSEKAKILFKMARRNLENLISGNAELNEARDILLRLIPSAEGIKF
jgi:hypothetical protein